MFDIVHNKDSDSFAIVFIINSKRVVGMAYKSIEYIILNVIKESFNGRYT